MQIRFGLTCVTVSTIVADPQNPSLVLSNEAIQFRETIQTEPYTIGSGAGNNLATQATEGVAECEGVIHWTGSGFHLEVLSPNPK